MTWPSAATQIYVTCTTKHIGTSANSTWPSCLEWKSYAWGLYSFRVAENGIVMLFLSPENSKYKQEYLIFLKKSFTTYRLRTNFVW